MRFRGWLTLSLGLATVLATAAAAAAGATGRPVRTQTLVFDARFTHEATAGPGPSHVGHEQIAGGVLRDTAGRTIGRFAFTCKSTRILPGRGALERCQGSGRTLDGRLDVAGPARSDEDRGSWRIVGGSGTYHGARGAISLRDISSAELLLTAQVTPAPGTVLSAGAVRRPAANAHFVRLANGICRREARGPAPVPVPAVRPAPSRPSATAQGRSVPHRRRQPAGDPHHARFAAAITRPARGASN